MIVLSDCLTNKIDEGCLKVANSLTKRLKKQMLAPWLFLLNVNRIILIFTCH